MWRKEAIPQDFKDASIIHIYKRKGNPQVCDNHKGISLLSIAGKIRAKILLQRLNAHLDKAGLIPESQCGFRKDRGTIDMIFTAGRLQEKRQEQNIDLYMIFVDLTKAFDTVSRNGLWEIMAKFSCPPRYIAMVWQFHDGMQARVQNDGEYSEPFPVTNGIKQGCVMAPTLFSMMSSAMFTDAFQDVDAGFPIRYIEKNISQGKEGTVKKGKQEPRDHHQTQHSLNSLALFATDSLELKLAYTAIIEHTNTHKRLIFRI